MATKRRRREGTFCLHTSRRSVWSTPSPSTWRAMTSEERTWVERVLTGVYLLKLARVVRWKGEEKEKREE